MNVHEATEIRELTATELNDVNGGSIIVNAIRMMSQKIYVDVCKRNGMDPYPEYDDSFRSSPVPVLYVR
jgi:hypothetical protein